jgi:signal transduction histidine kinase/CBS domain-containing protein
MFNSPTQIELTSAIIRNPIVVTPETKVLDAIAQMSGVRSQCVLAVENTHLLGIFTEQDVVELIAQQKPLHNLVMREVMSPSVVTLRESDFTDTLVAINLIQQHHMRYLPIVDDSDRLVGIVTDESLHQLLKIQLQKLIADLEKKHTELKFAKKSLLASETRFRRVEELIRQQVDQEKLLAAITQRIRLSLNLSEILKTAVEQVHQVLKSDRVLVYRVFPNGTGSAIAESVLPQWPPILDIAFPEEVFPKVNYDRYIQGRIFALSDREAEPNQVLPCLAEFLAEIQVRAKLVVPIVQNNTLWGLLIVHQCDRPRHWQVWEINLLQQIANQLAIAIQQADLFEKLQQELCDRQKTQQHLTEINQKLALSNEELARATRLKDEFLANMSHELRTPLNAILGMTEGMQEQIFGKVTSAQTNALQTIERSGSHLLELINEILDLAKIESGQIDLEYSKVSVEFLCQSCITFIKQQAHKKNIQIETKILPNLSELNIDERRVRQVLINLLNNAVKFTPSGGRIILEVSSYQPSSLSSAIVSPQPEIAVAKYLYFSVIDTGIGIAPENISKLFQPFIQIDSALNRQYQGTGLGLALVKRIVEIHGGNIILTSEIGVGSCFTIALPYTAPVGALPTVINQTEIVSAINQNTQSFSPQILLVEANEANIMTISSYLTAKGYNMVVAKNGREAISFAQGLKPNLILMDMQISAMDGLEATKQIRQIRSLDHVPIIAITSLATENDVERCLAAGANDYLSKPVKLRQLTKLIQQFLVLN